MVASLMIGLLAMVQSLISPLALPAGPSPAATITALPFAAGQTAGNDGADVHGAYTYALDVEGAEVDVFIDVTMEASKADEQTADGVYQYYLFQYQMVVPTSAADLVVSDAQGSLEVGRESFDLDGFDIITIDLRRNLFYGQSTVLSVRYSLRDDLANFSLDSSVTAVIVNPASAGWFVFTDGGLDSWEVTIEAPAGFEPIDHPDFPNPFKRQPTEADGLLRMAGSGAGEGAFYFILLESEDGMEETVIDGPGTEIILRHWPGDETWTDQVISEIDTHLPNLTALIGMPWPEAPLTIQESAVPLSSTYAGWYLADKNLIVVGPRIDNLTVMHEIAHVWVNHDTLGDRWTIEGLASEFAALAVAGDSDRAENPPADATLDSELAHPLSDWQRQDPEVEAWDYGASWQLIRRLREEMGIEAFLDATRSAIEGATPYPGPGDTEVAAQRRSNVKYNYVDYLEQAAPELDLAPMVADWVDGGWNDSYEERANARQAYTALEADGAGWMPPLVVREAMAAWRFDEAVAAMAEAENLLDERDRVNEELSSSNLTVPATMEQRYEAAVDGADLAAVADDLDRNTQTVIALDQMGRDPGLIERVGMVGSGFDHDRQLAKALYTTGQFDQMEASAAAARTVVDSSRGRGLLRLGLGAVALAFAGFGLGLRRRSRRRRRRRQIATASA